MSIGNLLLCSSLFTGLTGCMENEIDLTAYNKDKEAVVFSTRAGAVQTRAGENGELMDSDRIGIYMLEAGNSFATRLLANNHKYKPEITGGVKRSPIIPDNALADQTIYYPQKGNVDFVAYCPYKPAGTGMGMIDPLYRYPVDVSDQSNPAAIDLLYIKKTTVSKSNQAVTLSFDHQLSKVTMRVKPGNSLREENFSTLTAALSGIPVKADFAMETHTITPGATAPTPVSMRKTGMAAGNTALFESILIPHAGGEGRFVTFTLGAGSYTWNIPSSTVFESGKHHIYDVTVNKTSVTVGGNIIPWFDESGLTGDAHPIVTPGGLHFINYSGDVLVTFTDQSTVTVNVNSDIPVSLPTGSEQKVVKSLKLNGGAPILIGRPGHDNITLKFSGANPVFRDAVNGARPVGSYAEFQLINSVSNGIAGSYFLEANLNLMDELWKPVGNSTNKFTGAFDGKGFRIENLHIEGNGSLGLFGYTGKGSKISNLHIASGSIRSDSYTGGIVGYSDGVNIDNCSNRATLNNAKSGSGGIIGMCMNGSITNCTNYGNITSGTGNGAWIGGICGVAEGNTSITNCANHGDVTTTYSAIAGICGVEGETAMVTACYNTGAIQGSGYVGGIIGQINNSIIASYNTGTITATRESSGYAGGVVGGSSESSTNVMTITGCYSTGDVFSSAPATNFGSIVGLSSKNTRVTHCYWAGVCAGMLNGTKFGNGTNSTGWPSTALISSGWGVASGNDGGTNGKYWKTLGSFDSNTYPQLWWE
jgi:hypothetical protein